MTKWDKIPQEVLQQILKLLDYRNVFQVTDEWPLVNRQWYSTYQSFAYKEIVVDLDLTFKHNVKARNILNCVDQPGLLVKSITLIIQHTLLSISPALTTELNFSTSSC